MDLNDNSPVCVASRAARAPPFNFSFTSLALVGSYLNITWEGKQSTYIARGPDGDNVTFLGNYQYGFNTGPLISTSNPVRARSGAMSACFSQTFDNAPRGWPKVPKTLQIEKLSYGIQMSVSVSKAGITTLTFGSLSDWYAGLKCLGPDMKQVCNPSAYSWVCTAKVSGS